MYYIKSVGVFVGSVAFALKSGLLSRIVQSRHSVCFVCNSWCQ